MPETNYSPDPRARPPVWFGSRRYGARAGGYSGGDHSTDPSGDPIATSIRSSLIGYYPLDGTLDDLSSYAMDQSINGGSFSYISGKVGQCVSCSGVEFFDTRPAGSDAHFWVSDDFEISLWAYLDNTGIDYGLFNAGNAYNVGYYAGTGFALYLVGGGGNSVIDPTPISNATWYHVQAWWDRGVGLYISVNGGAAVSSLTADTTLIDSFQVGLTRPGHWTEGGSFGSGRLDEVAVWARQLTTAERAWVYNSGAGRALV